MAKQINGWGTIDHIRPLNYVNTMSWVSVKKQYTDKNTVILIH